MTLEGRKPFAIVMVVIKSLNRLFYVCNCKNGC